MRDISWQAEGRSGILKGFCEMLIAAECSHRLGRRSYWTFYTHDLNRLQIPRPHSANLRHVGDGPRSPRGSGAVERLRNSPPPPLATIGCQNTSVTGHRAPRTSVITLSPRAGQARYGLIDNKCRSRCLSRRASCSVGAAFGDTFLSNPTSPKRRTKVDIWVTAITLRYVRGLGVW